MMTVSKKEAVIFFFCFASGKRTLWTLESEKGPTDKSKVSARNLVGSDQQMQKLEETELRKADRTVGVNCNIFSNISSGTAWLLQGIQVRGQFFFRSNWKTQK